MKKDLHPTDYRLVVFQDTSSDFKILTKSTAPTDETIKWEDGNEYPLIKVHISSASHPYFTGEEKIVDVEGRVDKFKARAEAAKKALEARKAAAEKAAKQPAKKAKKSEETKTDAPEEVEKADSGAEVVADESDK
ncbi:type B 50S ribosomal protein L31 [Candidatus Saccharibacteria bacterium]|nr:type B 50S ribosomal protein L31 [Candidatus Saccharibacteria bacterium]